MDEGVWEVVSEGFNLSRALRDRLVFHALAHTHTLHTAFYADAPTIILEQSVYLVSCPYLWPGLIHLKIAYKLLQS